MQTSPSSFPTLLLPASADAQIDSFVSDQRGLRSSPISISSSRRRSNNLHSVAATPHSRLSEHHWSLFGQLMENEGHLGVTPSSISNASRRSSSPGDYFTRGSSILSESTHSNLRPFVQTRPEESNEESPHADLALHGISVEAREYDSDDSSSSISTLWHPANHSNAWSAWTHHLLKPSMSLVWRNVFKCAIAYFVASLFTFSPYLSGLIAPVTSGSSKIASPSGHMVATM